LKPTKTILMVDDVPMFRELASLFLARTANVVTAESAEVALRIARRRKLDLVISDLHMPGMDGAALCREIKSDARTAQLPFVMLLRENDPTDRRCAVHAGADDVLSKPLSRSSLIDCVNHFLETGLTRGLPRVDLVTPVQVRSELFKTWGTVRNISRAGICVEADCEFAPKAEVVLDFRLPEENGRISPRAEVMWCHEAPHQRAQSMGMRFLSVDPKTMRSLDDYLGDQLAMLPPQPTG